MIDSHCHLDPKVYGAEVDAVIARAVAAGVDRMVTIGAGYGFDAAEAAVLLCARHPNLRCAIGLHPHDAHTYTDDAFARLLALSRAPGVVALGEMGLDFHYDLSPRDVQRDVFRRQLAAARERGLPVVIHDRASEGETLRILVDDGQFPTGVLYHCYTGDVAAMREITHRGGYVSIPGIVTFKNAGEMPAVAAEAPLDRLLVETDSPFLTPVPFRGKRNEPAHTRLVLAKVAELRGMPVAELERATIANTERFFRW